MQAWWTRPLESVYAAVFIDAIMVKVRDGQVRNRPVYAAIGVDLDGHKDILGMWAGDGDGESAKFWLAVLTELKNRGVHDVFFVVCDGLKGLPDSVSAVFPLATVQTCIIHLIRGTFRFVSRKYWDTIAKDLKPIYQADTPGAAAAALDALEEKWGRQYPAMIRLWRNAWAEFIPFLDYDLEIRRVICSTNAIESLNARFRRAVRARGHFPNELGDENPLSGHPVAGPDRHRRHVGGEVEASAQRVRHHLCPQRKPADGNRHLHRSCDRPSAAPALDCGVKAHRLDGEFGVPLGDLVAVAELGGQDRCGDMADEVAEGGVGGVEEVDAEAAESVHDRLRVEVLPGAGAGEQPWASAGVCSP